jgi:hypothetical protein
MCAMQRLLLIVVLLAVAAFPLLADTSVQTFTQPLTVGEWSNTWVVQPFDPSLGTLTGIRINHSVGASGLIGAEYTGDVSCNLNMSTLADVDLFWPDHTELSFPGVGCNITFSVSAYDNVLDYAGTSGQTSTFSDSAGKTYPIDPSLWALFTGTGTISLPVETTIWRSSNTYDPWWGPTTLNPVSHTDSWATTTVYYDYSNDGPPQATPEPGTMALLGLGLPMAGLWLRKRRKA